MRDVIVVGAGAAGVGIGVALKHAGVTDFEILDRHDVGASFERWPRQMRFITPSFPTNSVGMLDLNAVAVGSSPGHALRREHPSGTAFAAYLRSVADHFELTVAGGVDVLRVTKMRDGFRIETSAGLRAARCLVWAAGEFQYPRLRPFPGGELAMHLATIGDYDEIPGREAVVIGGYESGMDAALYLAAAGRAVTVIDPAAPWEASDSDPSRSLSPVTHERLRRALREGHPLSFLTASVKRIIRDRRGYLVVNSGGRSLPTAVPPLLATGFKGGVTIIHDLFESRDDGFPLLNDHDESTIAPGLFLAGPLVRHDRYVFCFVYKFRQRFAVVARAVGERLGLDTSALDAYRPWGMFLDDLSCCGQECVC